MNRLSELLVNRKSGSSSDNEEEQDHVNSIEITISNIENKLQNWSIPKQDVKTLYKIGSFEFFQSYSIKTTEKTLPLLQDHQSINLFSGKAIKEYRKHYKYLHVGLVQVAIKPLTRLGINAPICMILRDARLLKFDQSLLALAESNICNGPIYFNCYPDFTVALRDPNILDVLTLDIKMKNIEMKEGSDPLAVIYRVYYKVMSTTVEPRALIDHTKNETIIFEANLENSQICIPKKLKWEEIRRNETWNLEEMNQPKPLKLNKDITNIVEHTNGNIQISFGKNIGESSRHSTYVPSSIISENEKEYLRRSQSLKFKGVDFSNSIPKPVYEEDNKSDETVSTYNYKPTE
ncbi:enzymatic polyprotein, partial [Tanacetum coccineum]